MGWEVAGAVEEEGRVFTGMETFCILAGSVSAIWLCHRLKDAVMGEMEERVSRNLLFPETVPESTPISTKEI